MLISKFTPLFTSRIPKVRTLLTYAPCLNNRVSSHTGGNIFDKKSRCLEHRKALEKCPKARFSERCKIGTYIPDNTPHSKCCWSSGDDYRRAYQAIKKRSEKLTKLVESLTTRVLEEVRRSVAELNENETILTKKILDSVGPRVLELSRLDPICGMRKKLDVLMLNDRTHQELSWIRCARDLEIESIECELERLNCELKSRANCALEIVHACRKSESPQDLIRCVGDASREASKMLDDATEHFEICTKKLQSNKQLTMTDDKKRIEEVVKIYEKNMSELIAGVDDCIRIRKFSS